MDTRVKEEDFQQPKTKVYFLDDLAFPLRQNYFVTMSDSSWKILVVDDDEEVHLVTKILLRNLSLDGQSVSLYHSYSSEEALTFFNENLDLAVILLDIVMETETAGIDLIRTIRTEYPDHPIRIIVRTGQPGMLNPKELVETLDINDYRTKTELSNISLYTTVMTNLRTYKRLSYQNQMLEVTQRDLLSNLVWYQQRTQNLWESQQHGLKMYKIVELLGLSLGLGSLEARSWGIAAGFHDLGMDFLDPLLLTSSEVYTHEQRGMMEQHCLFGYEHIQKLGSHYQDTFLHGLHKPPSSMVETICLEHHENWNGTGYPQGLVGNQIAMSARSTRCADLLVSLSEPRSYRPVKREQSGLSSQPFWDKFSRMTGEEIDPQLVDHILRNKDSVNTILFTKKS